MQEQLKALCIKKTEDSMTLHECLSAYTKVRLAEVGAAYDYSIPQSKKKGDIVDFMTAVIKSDMIRYFSEEGSSYTAAVYDILQNSRPVIREEDLESIRGPLDKGLVFLKKDGEDAVAFLPSDVMAIFEVGREGNRKETREERIFTEGPVHKTAQPDRTPEEEEMIMYAGALAHMYGIFPIRQMREVWYLNHGKHLPPKREQELIVKAGDEDGFYMRDHYIIDTQITDPEDYCNILDRIMPDDNYFYPTKSDLEEYKEGNVINRDVNMHYLRNFLARMTGKAVPVKGDDEELDTLMEKLAYGAKCDNTLSQVMTLIESEGIILSSAEDQQRFISLYTGWLYGMRIWACKGFCPKDMPPSKMSVRNFRLPANVDPSAPVKIGRNDPCLCGSGKKIKKCCMSCL